MRKTILIISFCGMLSWGYAQTSSRNPLRDSLAAAAQLSTYYPDSIDLRLKKASWNIQLHEWEYAKTEYDYILKRVPTNLAALYYRAYVNEKLNRFSFAKIDYESLLQLTPGNFEARLGLALLNEKMKRYTEAMDQLNQLVEAHPDSAIVYAARGGVEKEHNQLETAEYDFSKAIELCPSNTDYLLNRADLYIKLGKKGHARKDLDRLVSLGLTRIELQRMYQLCR